MIFGIFVKVECIEFFALYIESLALYIIYNMIIFLILKLNIQLDLYCNIKNHAE